MNQELINIIDFYKAGDIEKIVLENEIGRLLSGSFYVNVILDDLENKNNRSYIAMVIPEMVNGVYKEKFVIDKDIIDTKLSSDKVCLLLEKMYEDVPKINKIYHEFIYKNKDTEVSFLECVQLFIKMYCNFIFDLPVEIFDTVADFKTTVEKDTSDILLAIQSGNEPSHEIVSHILLNHTLPKIALTCAENLFKNINVPVEDINNKIKEQEIPESDVMHADMASQSNGVINPGWREDLDPFYIPK